MSLTNRRKKRLQNETLKQKPDEEVSTPDISVSSAVDPPPESAQSSWLGLAKGVRTLQCVLDKCYILRRKILISIDKNKKNHAYLFSCSEKTPGPQIANAARFMLSHGRLMSSAFARNPSKYQSAK